MHAYIFAMQLMHCKYINNLCIYTCIHAPTYIYICTSHQLHQLHTHTYIYIYIYLHKCINTYKYYIHTDLHPYIIYIYIYAYIHNYMQINIKKITNITLINHITKTCIHLYVNAYIIYAYMHAWICMHTQSYKHTNNLQIKKNIYNIASKHIHTYIHTYIHQCIHNLHTYAQTHT